MTKTSKFLLGEHTVVASFRFRSDNSITKVGDASVKITTFVTFGGFTDARVIPQE